MVYVSIVEQVQYQSYSNTLKVSLIFSSIYIYIYIYIYRVGVNYKNHVLYNRVIDESVPYFDWRTIRKITNHNQSEASELLFKANE